MLREVIGKARHGSVRNISSVYITVFARPRYHASSMFHAAAKRRACDLPQRDYGEHARAQLRARESGFSRGITHFAAPLS